MNTMNISSRENNSMNPANAFRYKISKAGTVKISAYISSETEVVIPAQIEGCPVIGFNKDVFRNNHKITSVTWPSSIPIIPKEMFYGCTELKSILIPGV